VDGVVWLFAAKPIIVYATVRVITRIAIPWWCKRTNGSLNEANRQRATKRKLTILVPSKSVEKCVCVCARVCGCACVWVCVVCAKNS
jgi:hypothetical protein